MRNKITLSSFKKSEDGNRQFFIDINNKLFSGYVEKLCDNISYIRFTKRAALFIEYLNNNLNIYIVYDDKNKVARHVKCKSEITRLWDCIMINLEPLSDYEI